MKFKHPFLAALLVFLIFSCNSKEKGELSPEFQIIPEPREMTLEEGEFEFRESTIMVYEGGEAKEAAGLLRELFSKASGWDFAETSETPAIGYVRFQIDQNLENEFYRLEIANDKIEVSASGLPGFVHAVQSIRMLLPFEIESPANNNISWAVPALTILDGPRYEWRGFMLDVSRHFFEKDYVLQVIDRLSLFKMNTLHFHLVDDQGWRIEIKKYPKLTEVGAFRVDHEDKHWNARPTPQPGEEATLGGYYTQDEIKEIVAYAQKRGINVVPEIEMPAHVMSAIAAYPELSCFGNEIMVPSGGVWPITEIYCAGKESTFEFLEDVLLEVMELFPSKYIHVGGDEATKTNWEKCPDCQRRMHEEGLANVEELQSYFIKRMERFISSHDRILLGWDEILEGGLAPGATVMSWRGVQGGWEASEQGHDVVMTPASHVYFDYYQGNPDTEPLAFGGYSTLSKVYGFDPIVDSMSVEQKQHVLGGQANLWSEFISDTDHSEYMMFPRLVALSEVLWSPKDKKDWENFSAKLKENILPRFDLMNINYARSAYAVTAETEIDLESHNLKVKLLNEFPDTQIRYTINEDTLTESSDVYTQPIELSETTRLKAAVFENENRPGAILEKRFIFHKAVGKGVRYEPVYHDSYKGPEEVGLVNVLRGSLNFHDGQWQGWLVDDVEISIDLEELTEIKEVRVGTMENQGSGIYYPLEINLLVSDDGENFRSVGRISREFKENADPELRDFVIKINDPVQTKFIKVAVHNLSHPPRGGGAWLFIDEIIVN